MVSGLEMERDYSGKGERMDKRRKSKDNKKTRKGKSTKEQKMRN